jgi:pseudaminic acid biosynthesis-associated methylase
METVEVWQGEFGDQYTDRNVVNPEIRVNAFRAMLDGLNLNRVLEVGCNRGHNLAVLKSLYPDTELVGIEPNQQAREIANRDFPILPADTRDLLFRSGCFDLAFTAGVLIHISPGDLHQAMQEIARVSSAYILAIEYFAEEDTEVTYRGNTGLLWKRDFWKHYTFAVPHLTLLRSGYWDKKDGFDQCNYWLMKKVGENSTGH